MLCRHLLIFTFIHHQQSDHKIMVTFIFLNNNNKKKRNHCVTRLSSFYKVIALDGSHLGMTSSESLQERFVNCHSFLSSFICSISEVFKTHLNLDFVFTEESEQEQNLQEDGKVVFILRLIKTEPSPGKTQLVETNCGF